MDFSSLLKILDPDQEANATPIPSDASPVADPTANLPPLATQAGAQTGLMSSDSPTPSVSMTAQVPPSMLDKAPITASDEDSGGDTGGSANGNGSDVAAFIAKKYGFNPLMDAKALSNAQTLQNDQQLTANLGQAFDKIGSSIARTNESPEAQKFYQNLQEQAKNPVKDIIQQRQAAQQGQQFEQEQENEDPNSTKATITRKFYAPQMQKLGLDSNSLNGLSANDQKEFAQKAIENAAAQQSREEMAKLRLATLNSNKDVSRAAAGDKQKDKALTDTQQQLEQMRGNPAVQQAERDVYASNKLKSLVNLYGDSNKLSPAQVQLAASEIAKIATGGVPTSEELKGLNPSTIPKSLASLAGSVFNNPQSADAGKFLKQFQDYANTIGHDAQNTIKDRYGRILDVRKRTLRDDDYDTLKQNYLDRFSSPSSPTPSQGGIDMSGLEAEMKKRGLR